MAPPQAPARTASSGAVPALPGAAASRLTLPRAPAAVRHAGGGTVPAGGVGGTSRSSLAEPAGSSAPDDGGLCVAPTSAGAGVGWGRVAGPAGRGGGASETSSSDGCGSPVTRSIVAAAAAARRQRRWRRRGGRGARTHPPTQTLSPSPTLRAQTHKHRCRRP